MAHQPVSRALILYSAQGALDRLARALAEGLDSVSVRADVVRVDPSRQVPISLAPYDLVCVGSPSMGFFRGRPAPDVVEALARCTRLEGKRTAVFVRRSGMGSGRAIKALMAALERHGAWVEDFADLGSEQEAREFGQRLKSLARART